VDNDGRENNEHDDGDQRFCRVAEVDDCDVGVKDGAGADGTEPLKQNNIQRKRV
jgi:hypothetical protein